MGKMTFLAVFIFSESRPGALGEAVPVQPFAWQIMITHFQHNFSRG